ncbi:hypothetical protein NP493_150g01016 [Ridgeia piscesae]|uniref:2-oxoglutarate and iron-dependent oxygenase JMJD4 n=1 Tax=Ridgeia piscesae TaxID=27915 RepID=A0AAD9UFX9_RIDPI|nr:hypothetical protein NP493_150g01016 [Ridgeia piscesae]
MELSTAAIREIYENKIGVAELRKETYQNTQDIDVITKPIKYEEFFLEYLLPNRPCILDTWATDGWRSRKEWVLEDGQPDLEQIKTLFGGATCPVANCSEVKYNAHVKNNIKFADFIDYLKDFHRKEDDRECLYLKDWHFVRDFPAYKAYETAVFFQSDWLNEFYDDQQDQKDDYRFIYFGPQDSWTPLHADVMLSYSWSANVCGRKRWLLFPPGEEECMMSNLGQLAFDLNSPDMEDRKLYPRYGDVTRRLEVIQEAGQIIFVPSGWHHQVFNLEDTISINHNWLNGCNVDLCWEYVKRRLVDVQAEISDCREMDGWDGQCQLILKAIGGINFAEFFRFLHVIGRHRVDILKDTAGSDDCSKFHPRENMNIHNHVLFDLMQISKVISDMLAIPEFLAAEQEMTWECPSAADFLSEVNAIVGAYTEEWRQGKS